MRIFHHPSAIIPRNSPLQPPLQNKDLSLTHKNFSAEADSAPKAMLDKHRTYIKFVARNRKQRSPMDPGIVQFSKQNYTPTLRRNPCLSYFKRKKSPAPSFNEETPQLNTKQAQKNLHHHPGLTFRKNEPSLQLVINGRKHHSAKTSQELKIYHQQIASPPLKEKAIGKFPARKQLAKKIKCKQSSRSMKREENIRKQLFKGIHFHRDLGKGANAVVKSGIDEVNNRKIAIKVYQKKSLDNDDVRNIEREIAILHSLQHPNIIALYEIIETYHTINLILEYGGGNSLEQYMKSKAEGYLSERQAKPIFRQIVSAVDYLHCKKVAHRDIKTENILLDKFLSPKLIDFGFSLTCPEQDSLINSYCGTPTYMAPEVITKMAHNPLLSDRWALGILLFNMLNGHCPYKAFSQRDLSFVIHKGQYDYTSILSSSAVDLITSLLKKNPNERISPADILRHPWLQS